MPKYEKLLLYTDLFTGKNAMLYLIMDNGDSLCCGTKVTHNRSNGKMTWRCQSHDKLQRPSDMTKYHLVDVPVHVTSYDMIRVEINDTPCGMNDNLDRASICFPCVLIWTSLWHRIECTTSPHRLQYHGDKCVAWSTRLNNDRMTNELCESALLLSATLTHECVTPGDTIWFTRASH